MSRILAIAAAITLSFAAAAHAAPGAHAERDTLRITAIEKARILHRWAEDELLDNSILARERAQRDLELAIKLDPTNPDHWITLARVNQLGAFDKEARECLDRAVRLAPNDPHTHMERGRAWKREWIRTVDTLAFGRAIADFDTVTMLRPLGAQGWLALVPMRYERGDLAGASDAAERALASKPRIAEAGIAAAYTAYRRGDAERADSLFRATFPKLDRGLLALFQNVAPIMGAKRDASAPKPQRPQPRAHGSLGGDVPDEEKPAVGDSVTARSLDTDEWNNIDADPTTDVNETQLEFWSRVAHAWFVFWDPLRPGLDARADLYIRYGPPRGVEVTPTGVPLEFQANQLNNETAGASARGRVVVSYPMGVVRWNYPELGMGVVLNDRALNGRYEPAVARDFDFGSAPNPAVLARRGDLLSLDGGRSVFPTLPPPGMRIDVAGVTARFEGDRWPRLFAQVLAEGSPGDALVSKWVIQDSTGREVGHGSGSLVVSACDPVHRQLAEMSQPLPPGHYRLALSVRDQRRRRGLYRAAFDLAPPTDSLGLSDVVLACGDPSLIRGPSVRLDANVDQRVSGNAPMPAYFEIYRLRAGADGLAHFEVQYAVRRLSVTATKASKIKREPTLLSSSSREEATVAGLRRQFVNVQTQSLVPGHYQLEIRVRDLTTGTQIERTVAFDRL